MGLIATQSFWKMLFKNQVVIVEKNAINLLIFLCKINYLKAPLSYTSTIQHTFLICKYVNLLY